MYISFLVSLDDLCDIVAAFTRKLCTAHVDPAGIASFVACRLIALNKDPQVHPVEVSEVCRCLSGKGYPKSD